MISAMELLKRSSTTCLFHKLSMHVPRAHETEAHNSPNSCTAQLRAALVIQWHRLAVNHRLWGSSAVRCVAAGRGDGRGIVRWGSLIYAGEVTVAATEGRPHGAGVAVWKDGSRFEGQWAEGARDGTGTFTGAGAGEVSQEVGGGTEMYCGGWARGMRHGAGRLHTALGHVYEGEWCDGDLVRGKFVGRWHGRYEGEFRRLRRHGQGVWTSERGNQRYEGRWFDDLFDGEGLYTSSGKTRRYAGTFRAGKRHGHGTWKSGHGDEYSGEFVAGLFHGHGLLRTTSGCTYDGEWVEGQLHGQATYQSKQGVRYEGEWRRGKRHGLGTQTFRDGAVFTGTFKSDVFDGPGDWVDGCEGCGGSYRGDWSNGLRHGEGAWEGGDKDCYKGGFVGGSMCGEGELQLSVEDEPLQVQWRVPRAGAKSGSGSPLLLPCGFVTPPRRVALSTPHKT